MSKQWEKKYTELIDYVRMHDSIVINKDSIRINNEVRPHFYKLFNDVGLAFLRENSSKYLRQSYLLSKHYKTVKREVSKLIGLRDYVVRTDLRKFLETPQNGLARILLDHLFDLLKMKTDIKTFEQKASRVVELFFKDHFKAGYEKWIILSLVILLDCDQVFQIPLMELDAMELRKHMYLTRDQVPAPKASEQIWLDYKPSPLFVVPDNIFHSIKLKKYVAFKAGFLEPMSTAANPSKGREWYSMKTIVDKYRNLFTRLDIKVYIGNNPEEISLIADKNMICRPDLIVESKVQKDWYQQEELQKLKLHHNILKPKLGTYVVSRLTIPEDAIRELMPEPVAGELPTEGVASRETSAEQTSQELAPEQKSPPEEPEKQPPDIHILTVGYDRSKLEPIVSALMSWQ